MKLGRKTISLAEWVSLLLSAVIVLGLVAYLVNDLTKSSSEYISVSVSIEKDKIKSSEGRSIVPLKISNQGHRAAQSLKVLAMDSEIEIDYLAAGAEQIVYLFVDDAEVEKLTAKASSYTID